MRDICQKYSLKLQEAMQSSDKQKVQPIIEERNKEIVNVIETVFDETDE